MSTIRLLRYSAVAIAEGEKLEVVDDACLPYDDRGFRKYPDRPRANLFPMA